MDLLSIYVQHAQRIGADTDAVLDMYNQDKDHLHKCYLESTKNTTAREVKIFNVFVVKDNQPQFLTNIVCKAKYSDKDIDFIVEDIMERHLLYEGHEYEVIDNDVYITKVNYRDEQEEKED